MFIAPGAQTDCDSTIVWEWRVEISQNPKLYIKKDALTVIRHKQEEKWKMKTVVYVSDGDEDKPCVLPS